MGITALRAEERFSKTLSPADFAAAGLDRLSRNELARLDELAKAFQTQPLKARPDAAVQATVQPAAPPQGVAPTLENSTKPKPAKTGGFLPGLRNKSPKAPEPAAETSRIIGTVAGWNPRTVFTLENGQMWAVSNYDYYTCPAVKDPAVEIRPAAFGGFWMKIGSLPEVRVRLVSNPRTAPGN